MTMIRTLLCTILLGVASQAAASTLYRWTEPDGSLTFSPEPPTSGIAYDTVDTGGGNLASQAGNSVNQNLAQTTAAATPQIVATPQPAATPSSEPEIKYSGVPQSVPSQADEQFLQPEQTLAYAPNASNVLPQGITAGTAPDTDTATTASQNPNGVVGSDQKFGQCQELSKRVVSLERRLRSKLTTEEVDDTVIAIAQYQNNLDRHCE